MSLRNIDIEGALRRVADRRIEEAMREGKLDNLPGKGLPLELEPIPAEENARMTWWALRILKNNDFTPEEVAWRKALDHLRERIEQANDAQIVETLVADFNQLVHRLNTLGTNALHHPVAPLALEAQLERLRLCSQQTATSPGQR